MNNNRKRTALCLLGATLCVFMAFGAALYFGRYPITLQALLAGDAMAVRTFTVLRLPRAVMALAGGFGLGVVGFVYQTVFRNPLASPDIIGVSSGASVGAAFAILFVSSGTLGTTVCAFAGGLAAVFLSLGLAAAAPGRSKMNLVLAGIAVHALAQTLLMLLKLTADPEKELASIEYWIMGSLAEGKPLLQFRGVSIRKGLPTRRKWGRTVYDAPFLVQNADADFPAGCMTAVLGPSGTGKTTTFLSVLKQHPYTGRILFQGRDIAKMKPNELYRHIGIVFQNPANQFVTQNVEDEVCVGLRLWEPGLSDEACRQRAEELLDRYGLKRQRRYSPYMLSQGQQRRLAVLSVLAGGQELLLLDEPTYGQDARSVNAIMEHLREKVEQEGLTVIFITHDTELAAAWADQIYRLEDTALVEKSAEEVL